MVVDVLDTIVFILDLIFDARFWVPVLAVLALVAGVFFFVHDQPLYGSIAICAAIVLGIITWLVYKTDQNNLF